MNETPDYSHSAFNVGFGWGESCDVDRVDIEEYVDFIHTIHIYHIHTCVYIYIRIYTYACM